MNRTRTIIVVVLLLIVGGLWILLRSPQQIKLDDGTRLQMVQSRIGGEGLAPVRIGFWQELGGAAPDKLQNWLPDFMQPSGSAGGSSMWIEVPDPTNSLQIVFMWDGDAERIADHRLSAVIKDLNGATWYPSMENVRDVTGPNNEIVQVYTFHFAAFPRWQEELKVAIAKAGEDRTVTEPVAEFVAENPKPIHSPTMWKTMSLPAIRKSDRLHITLEGFQTNDATNPKLNPLTWEISSVEPDGDPVVTNAWHVAKAAVWDNYGNSALNGLHLRTPRDSNGIGQQWRLLLDLVAEQRSGTASNLFLTLPGTQLPAAGDANNLLTGTTDLAGVSIGGVHLVGPGEMKFIDGVLLTNSPTLPTEPGVRRRNGRRTAADGTMSRVVQIENRGPVLAVGVNGANESTWFSCRAERTESGKVFWLDAQRPPQAGKPQFSRLVNDGKAIYYNMDNLDPKHEWQITFGVHPIHQVEFLIERPTSESAD